MSAVLNYAMELAKQNVRFFQVRPNSKLPACKDYPNIASNDPIDINEMFAGNDFNSGIACGKVSEGLYLLGFDIDNKPGGKNGYETLALMEELGESLPTTWSQKTPSGGEHRLFWSPVPIRQGVNVCGPGIDFRSDGGYLVGPGSSIHGMSYDVSRHNPIANLPDWFISKYEKRATVISINSNKNKGLPAQNQILALKRSVEFLKAQEPTREGGRSHDCYRFAAQLKDYGLVQSQILDVMGEHWMCEPPISVEEMAFTINNAFKYGETPLGALEPDFKDESEPPQPEEEAPELIFNEDHFYMATNGVSRVCWETTRGGKYHLERFPVHSFHEKHLSRKVMVGGRLTPLTKLWMESPERREYDYTRFSPANALEPKAYNSWRGFFVEPKREASEKGVLGLNLFLQHCLENICANDIKLNEWFLDFMAHIFQFPGEKPEVSLVFKGSKGTGKTIVSEILDHLIGDNSVIIADKTHVLNHFNSIMEDKLLVTLDEAFWSGDKGVEGVLKDVITGRKRVITHKGQEPYIAYVYDRIVIIGNEQWLVPATSDERRFAVFNVGEGKQQDRKFFGAMKDGLLNGGGDSLLMQFFLDRKIDKDGINVAPETEGLNQQKDQSLNPFQAWWADCLKEGQVLGHGLNEWPKRISVLELRGAFYRQMEIEGNRQYRPSPISMGMMFKHFAKSCAHSKNTGSQREYFFSPLEEARNEWDKYRRFKTKWGEE